MSWDIPRKNEQASLVTWISAVLYFYETGIFFTAKLVDTQASWQDAHILGRKANTALT